MSLISGVGDVSSVATGINQLAGTEYEGTSNLFSSMLSDAIQQADDAHVAASEDTQALLSGEIDDLAQVMISGTKSELALDLVVQVRNKVIDAYTEIMAMQV